MAQSNGYPIGLLVFGGGSGLLLLASTAASKPAPAAIVLTNGEIHACFTPAGTMYLIKQPGLSQECKGNHVEVTWSIEGPQGDQGEQGDPGEQGPPGPAGVSGYHMIQSSPSQGVAIAQCGLGAKLLGGGFITTTGPIQAGLTINISTGQEGYRVEVADPNEFIVAEAYCATVGT